MSYKIKCSLLRMEKLMTRFSISLDQHTKRRSSASDSMFVVSLICSLPSLNLPDNSIIFLHEETGLVWSPFQSAILVVYHSHYHSSVERYKRSKYDLSHFMSPCVCEIQRSLFLIFILCELTKILYTAFKWQRRTEI